jgi:uncharacterized protein YjbI with pentapeptide repeats
MIDEDALTDAEQRLIAAVRKGCPCDFSDGHEDETEWGSERTISAGLLTSLMSEDRSLWDLPDAAKVDVRGAVVSGDLTGVIAVHPSLILERCRFDGRVSFDDATFDGAARFAHCTFKKPASFARAYFAQNAHFEGATFAERARFKGATFAGVSERKDPVVAHFDEAEFRSDAWFEDATFVGAAHFNRATFATTASFKGVTCTAAVSLREADFTGDAAKFMSPMHLRGSRVRATEFTGAVARAWDLTAAKFHTLDPGPWIGETVTLDSAVLFARSTVRISALRKVNAKSMQVREGARLMINSSRVDLAGADFVRSSIVACAKTPEPITVRRAKTTHGESLRDQTRALAEDRANELRDNIAGQLSDTAPQCKLFSLNRCTVGDLVLSNVALEECTFAGAHGLDRMRIATNCSFNRTRTQPCRDAFKVPWAVTNRRIISEEITWRRDPDASKLLAADIAGIYRDLRKGLEDVKNEPEAADFYYGEMEMRRLAGSYGRGSSRGGLAAPSCIERVLLYGYWAISGYGLRAWRATTMLVVLIAAAAFLFSYLGLGMQVPPKQIAFISLKDGQVTYVDTNAKSGKPEYINADTKKPALDFVDALNFSARESVSLLHPDNPTVETRGAGTLVDFALRLAGPVLLAFIVLALRARTKR